MRSTGTSLMISMYLITSTGTCFIVQCLVLSVYRGTSLMRNSADLGPYSRAMPRALWCLGLMISMYLITSTGTCFSLQSLVLLVFKAHTLCVSLNCRLESNQEEKKQSLWALKTTFLMISMYLITSTGTCFSVQCFVFSVSVQCLVFSV